MDKLFNPRSPLYKQPYGAVESGLDVTLTLRPQKALNIHRARLVAQFEQRNLTNTIELTWSGQHGNRNLYTCTLNTADYVGLIWYRFELDTSEGTRFLGPDGLLDKPGTFYQLTVYSGMEEINWFSQGVVYQIFPDRFMRTKSYPLGKDKWLHENWNELPAHTPTTTYEGREKWNADFFGGSLDGIISKLDYLADMGVTVLYINPIFQSFSNHRYDTGSYEHVDPLLGTHADFRRLCRSAHRRNMKVILDGVFNHTGSDSMYFNQENTYDTVGACQSKDSPYFPWYEFQQHPSRYSSWWGMPTLPSINEMEPSYLDYIIRGENSIIRRWIRAGADGWRLDVADELPDAFISELYKAVKEENPKAIVIGEVWEDATSKIAYDVRRAHLWGGHLDSVMNYPFKDAVITYLLNEDAGHFYKTMENIRENYPPAAFKNNMNFLGTHDTPRILTVLGTNTWPESKDAQAGYRLSDQEYAAGKRRLKLAVLILMTFPGAPTIYYGDEAGLSGFADPFNRGTYPWGNEDQELKSWYRTLTHLRNTLEPLKEGNIHYLKTQGPLLAYTRRLGAQRVLVAVNASDSPLDTELPWRGSTARDRISNQYLNPLGGVLKLRLPSSCGMVITE